MSETDAAETRATCPCCACPLPAGGDDTICLRCALNRALEGSSAEWFEGGLDPPHPGRAAGPPRAFEDYELYEEIGRGGMGIVYRGLQRSLGRPVAIKMLLGGDLATLEARARFHAESAAAGRLRHPHIVTVFESGEHDGAPWFSMEYVPGRVLTDLVRENPLPPRVAARYVRTVAQAVQHAHEHGIIHRDLKPGNILLDAEDEPRVTDFGLARCLDTDTKLTRTGQALGSPNYMAPEQVEPGTPVSHSADVYGLGALLYHLATGRPPFQAPSPLEVLRLLRETEPVPPRRLNRTLPRDLETICLKALEKSPDQRYPSAQAVAEELTRFLDGTPIHARPVSPIIALGRWCRRRPALSSLLAIIGLLVTVLGLFLRSDAARSRADSAAKSVQLRESHLREAESLLQGHNAGRTRRALGLVHRAARMGGDETFREALRETALAALTQPDFESRPAPGGLSGSSDDLAFFFRREEDGRWSVCPRETGEVHRTLPEGVIPERLARGGRWLVTRAERAGGHDLIDLLAPDFHRTLALPWAQQVLISPDGQRLMGSGAEKKIEFFDLPAAPAGEALSSAVLQSVYAPVVFALSPDGRAFAETQDALTGPHTIRVRDARTGANRWQANLLGYSRALSWSQDGRWLAAAVHNQSLVILDASKGTLVRMMSDAFGTSELQFSPDGAWLASGGADRLLQVWDIGTGQILGEWPGSAGHLGFSADGRLLAPFQQGGRPCEARIVPGHRANLRAPGAGGQVYYLGFSPDGALFAMADEGQTSVWDPGSGRCLGRLPEVWAPTFSPDGQWLYGVGRAGGVRWPVIASPEGSSSVAFDRQEKILGEAPIGELVFSADGRSGAAFLLGAGRAVVWPTEAPAERRQVPVPTNANNSALSADGRWLCVTTWPGEKLTILDLPSSQPVLERPFPASRQAFSPDGRWLAVAPEAFEIWETGTWKKVRTLRPVGTRAGGVLAFSPDGGLLATVSDWTRIDLWQTGTWRHLATLHSPSQLGVFQIGFSPGARWMATGLPNGGVELWDLAALRRDLGELAW